MRSVQKINLRSKESLEFKPEGAERDSLCPANVADPALYVFLPEKKPEASSAVLMLPGGGYNVVALAQCFDAARWLNSLGLACMVLEYRLPGGNPEKPLEDIKNAWLHIKEKSAEWGVDAKKLGIMGFSAGGQLAANWSTLFANEPELRPEFTILHYPVIDLHEASLAALARRFAGEDYDRKELYKYSAHLQVGEHTPPALVMLSDDDAVVPPMHGVYYYEALKKYNISASLHVFASGGHAWSLGDGKLSGQPLAHTAPAMEITADWLLRLG